MKKLIRIIPIAMCIMFVLCGCSNLFHKQEFSDDILVGYSLSGAGFGTYYDCMSATVIIYKDHTVKIKMNIDGEPEIASFKMSDEDYAELEKVADPNRIYKLKVIPNNSVCDGNSNYLYVYTKDNDVISIGGYMPIGKKFWKTFNAIRDIMEPYDVEKIKADYVQKLEEEDLMS